MINVLKLREHMFDVVAAILDVHEILGPGINEYCYQEALSIELERHNIPFQREVSFHPDYRGQHMKSSFRLDFLCKGDIIVECKAVESLIPINRAQLFNYMRLLKMPCGILVNFMPETLVYERYFYDIDTSQILSVKGLPFRSLKSLT